MTTTRTTTTTKKKKRKTTTKTRNSGRKGGQRGVALILVLWTFAAVAVLAAEFARAMHDEAASTRNFKESTQARMVAMAGLNEVILALKADRERPELVEEVVDDLEDPDAVRSLAHADGQWVPAGFRGKRYEVRVIDEGGKLAINKLTAEQFRAIFENLEIPEDEAEIITDSILDWSDSDDLHLTNGAESEYYEGLDRPYHAKNAMFDSVEELMLVRGVTREIFYGRDGFPGLVDIFSTFNKTRTLNPKSVTPEVMQALTGIDAEEANELSNDRRHSDGAAANEQLRVLIQTAGLSPRSRVAEMIRIEARVHDSSGTVVLAHIGAVMNLSRDGEGLKLYRWYDSIFDDSDESGGTSAADTTS